VKSRSPCSMIRLIVWKDEEFDSASADGDVLERSDPAVAAGAGRFTHLDVHVVHGDAEGTSLDVARGCLDCENVLHGLVEKTDWNAFRHC